MKDFELIESAQNKEFWTWFKDNAERFFQVVKLENKISANFINPVSEKLNALRNGYFLLAGMYSDDVAELIITADGDVRVIPFIEKLVNQSPTIHNWKITALKHPSERDDFAVNFSLASLSSDTLFFVFKEDKKYPDLIDIDVVHEDILDANKRLFEQGIFIFLENYIGEIQSIELIDSIEIKARHKAVGELIPISKLSSFLNWRRKEFVEKYDSVKHTTNEDEYTDYESRTNKGKTLIATINTHLLNWEHLAAYPWVAVIRLKYIGTNGMPTIEEMEQLESIEDMLNEYLSEGLHCLNVGRETGDGLREVYFVCKGFRTPAIALDKVAKMQMSAEIEFDIRKDKYWKLFNRFKAVTH